MVNLVRRIRELETQLDNINRMTAAQRVGCSLMRLCAAHGFNPLEFRLTISKTTLALRAGITCATLSRSITKVPDLGINIKGKTVKINSIKCKKTICGDCIGTEHCKAFRVLHGEYKD